MEAVGNDCEGYVKDRSNSAGQGMMYKALEQSVLLYDSNIWVVTKDMLKVLEGFHQWLARRIMGMTANRGAGREWECAPEVAGMEAAGLHPIGEYIRRRQGTIVENVACNQG